LYCLKSNSLAEQGGSPHFRGSPSHFALQRPVSMEVEPLQSRPKCEMKRFALRDLPTPREGFACLGEQSDFRCH
jgi:hypothetical protein